MRILIVDGDAEARTALGGILGAMGGTVRGAETICDAVRSLLQEEFHLLVLDLHQPGFPCETALATLREVAPHVPVVLTTPDPGGREAARWALAGATRLLAKPFSAAQVLDAVGLARPPGNGPAS